MKRVIFIRIFRCICILFFCVLVQIIILEDIVDDTFILNRNEFSVSDSRFRQMDFSQIDLNIIDDFANEYNMSKWELIVTAMYYKLSLEEGINWDKKYIWSLRNNLIADYEDFKKIENTIKSIVQDMVYFPVPKSVNSFPYVDYVNSWNFERTYGGKRLHEGCDIMAQKNERGIYPIVSVCDGVIEQMGWLEKGGYRIGIRSLNGVYYYYAHLSEYADISIGDTVKAGELIGFMGDTGYGTAEGTTGKFDVHLHFGIYIDENGCEISLNPYWFLKYIENKVLYFDYGM